MKITSVETLHCDAGWRPWTFIKITTDDGLIGWSECTDSHGSPRGIEGVVRDLSPLLVGQDPRAVEKLYWQMYSRTRQSPGSIIAKAIGGIENALLDIKAKSFGVPVYELLGGAVRDKVPVYWSHWGTPRVRASQFVNYPPIRSVDDVRALGEETKQSGFIAIKPKITTFIDGKPEIFMPGFARSNGGPELNADPAILCEIDKWAQVLRESVGEEMGIMFDLNFNFKTEGFIAVGRLLEKYNPFWFELDIYNPQALRMIKDSIKIPVASCEDLYGLRQFRPYFEAHAMDIALMDVMWNGFIRSKQIADMAELYEMNVAPHNHNGHLGTFISAQFSALIPNLRIMEYTVEDVPWRDELFTNIPEVKNGCMDVPKKPGWGTEVREEVLREHPWKGGA